MPRSFSAGFEAAIALERSELVHLIQLEYSGGTLYLTTASGDITWDSKTFQAVGGTLEWEGPQEGQDRRAQGMELVLPGVDGSIISTILSNHFRGRPIYLWIAHLDPDTGALVSDPELFFRGFQAGDYQIDEMRDAEERGLRRGSVTIRTQVASRASFMERRNEARTNPISHRAMLKRGGFTGTDLDDAFFTKVAAIVNKPCYWGMDVPTGGKSGGSGGGGDDDTGRAD